MWDVLLNCLCSCWRMVAVFVGGLVLIVLGKIYYRYKRRLRRCW